MADELAARLAAIDPANAADFAANASTLHRELDALDNELEAGLDDVHEQVPGHEPRRRSATSPGATGLSSMRSPGSAPRRSQRPRRLAAVADFVTANGVRTVYYETLVSPAVAETIAGETGALVAVLDPIEGFTRRGAGRRLLQLDAGQPRHPATWSAVPVTEPLIELAGGVIGYGGRPLVEADLRVERGEVVAVVGANGSGKTTLVKGVLGLAELLDGTLHLFGQPADQFRERFRLGYVPQRQTLGGPLTATVTEVVTTGRLARKRRFQPLAKADRAAVAAGHRRRRPG